LIGWLPRQNYVVPGPLRPAFAKPKPRFGRLPVRIFAGDERLVAPVFQGAPTVRRLELLALAGLNDSRGNGFSMAVYSALRLGNDII
jgi:hypothetical protein